MLSFADVSRYDYLASFVGTGEHITLNIHSLYFLKYGYKTAATTRTFFYGNTWLLYVNKER